MRLCIIARMDHSGLGHQTRNLVRLLNPDKVIAIDFTFYNKFEQHPEWYEDYNTTYISGFLRDQEVQEALKDVDVVLTAETFYNKNFIEMAHQAGVVTVSQVNYEFFDPLMNRRLRIPHRVLMPSYWMLEEMQKMTYSGVTRYLPPPTFIEDFKEVREQNYNRTGKRRFVHIAGKVAEKDRAGTLDLLEAVKRCKQDFELVVKVQKGTIPEAQDDRVTFDHSKPDDERELYRDFDAMIHPRRYAGLNLPMNEALASGLPVIMTDVSPNNQVLPQKWLVPAPQVATFNTRTTISLHSAAHSYLAAKLDEMATLGADVLKTDKEEALAIANREYSPEVTLSRWNSFIKDLQLSESNN